MTYLWCARRYDLCPTPVIDPEHDSYYVRDGVTHCQHCAEQRGWHLLKKKPIIERVRQGSPEPVVAITSRPQPLNPLHRRLQSMDVPHFGAFMETAAARLVTSPESLQRLAELVYSMSLDTDYQFHDVQHLLRWWPKLTDEPCPRELVPCYNRRLEAFLGDVKSALCQRSEICFQCGYRYSDCVADLLVLPALVSLMSAENLAQCQEMLQLCLRGVPDVATETPPEFQAPSSPAPQQNHVPWWQRPRDQSI